MRRKRDKNRGTWPISRRPRNFQLFLPGFHFMLCHQKNDNWKNLSKTSIHSLDGKGAKNGLLLLPPDASERLFLLRPLSILSPLRFLSRFSHKDLFFFRRRNSSSLLKEIGGRGGPLFQACFLAHIRGTHIVFAYSHNTRLEQTPPHHLWVFAQSLRWSKTTEVVEEIRPPLRKRYITIKKIHSIFTPLWAAKVFFCLSDFSHCFLFSLSPPLGIWPLAALHPATTNNTPSFAPPLSCPHIIEEEEQMNHTFFFWLRGPWMTGIVLVDWYSSCLFLASYVQNFRFCSSCSLSKCFVLFSFYVSRPNLFSLFSALSTLISARKEGGWRGHRSLVSFTSFPVALFYCCNGEPYTRVSSKRN